MYNVFEQKYRSNHWFMKFIIKKWDVTFKTLVGLAGFYGNQAL